MMDLISNIWELAKVGFFLAGVVYLFENLEKFIDKHRR